MEKDYLDLLELQTMLKESIEEAFPERFWVKAEISSLSPRANGHCYLSLVQSDKGKIIAECKAMIWKWNYLQLKAYFEQETSQELKAGLTVLVYVKVSYSELYGISLFIDDIDPAFTLGEAALERKRNTEKLTEGGYMEMQRELCLPPLPRRLAVISSETAAGYGDFCRHLKENEEGYAFSVELFEAMMQGAKAPESISKAIAKAAEGPFDAILILRGGGSELDLACFDDYDLAVAIATCPLPIVTAIGHDRDYHIADMVANRFVKTPTALADLFLDAFAAEDARIDALEQRIQREVLRRRQEKLAAMERPLTEAIHRLRFAFSARLNEAFSKLSLVEAGIRSSDPRNILSLGYVLVTGPDNKLLKSVGKISPGDRIGVRLSDGSLTARVENVLPEHIDNDLINTA